MHSNAAQPSKAMYHARAHAKHGTQLVLLVQLGSVVVGSQLNFSSSQLLSSTSSKVIDIRFKLLYSIGMLQYGGGTKLLLFFELTRQGSLNLGNASIGYILRQVSSSLPDLLLPWLIFSTSNNCSDTILRPWSRPLRPPYE